MAGKLESFETTHMRRGGQFHMSEDCDLLAIVLNSEVRRVYANDGDLTPCRYLNNMQRLNSYTPNSEIA